MAYKSKSTVTHQSLKSEKNFHKSVFDKISCPTIVIDYSACIVDFNESAKNEFQLHDSSYSESILKQEFIPQDEINKIAQSIAKERLKINTGKQYHSLLNSHNHTIEYQISANTIEHNDSEFIVINFDKAFDNNINSIKSYTKEGYDKVNLHKISEAFDLCKHNLIKAEQLAVELLKNPDLNKDELDKLFIKLECNYKSIQLTLSKLNILNKYYNNTFTPDFKYHSLSSLIDNILDDLNPLIQKLEVVINKKVNKNSFAFIDKDSFISLLTDLLFIKLATTNKGKIDLETKENKDSYEISMTCCKGDFPYSKKIQNLDDEFYSELLESEHGLNKSVWHMFGNSLLDINKGSISFSDLGDDETIHIKLPVSAHSI